MRGRKPKPTHLKIIEGNPGKRPLPKGEPRPDPTRAIVAPPVLGEAARALWDEMAPELIRLGVLTFVDAPSFAAYCRAWGVIVEAEVAMARMAAADPVMGALVIRTAGGTPIQNPMLGIINRAWKDLVRYGAEFGLTPAARARITTQPQDEDDPLSRLLGS